MARNCIPRPPQTFHRTSMMIQDGITAAHIWVFSADALATIETQYATAQQIAERIGCSRATAYRIIKRHKKRYWLIDLRPDEAERCLSVLPLKELDAVQLHPAGNPNFHSGIYQQEIALRRRRVQR